MVTMDKDWYQKGLQLKQKGRHQKAIQAFDQAINHKTKFAEAYFERGICFYRLGNNRQALNDLEAAALLGCKAAQFWNKYDWNRFQKSNEDDKT